MNQWTTLKSFSHKVGINYWHMEFTTKYRYKMFAKEKQHNLMLACLRNVANKHKIIVHELFVMPDHVHMLISLPHNMTDSKALQLLKGGSSYKFFKNHPKSRLRLPQGHLWSEGGCAITVGYNEYSTVQHYIQEQANHHATA